MTALSPEELAAIGERVKAATPGPWVSTRDGSLVCEPGDSGSDLFHVLPTPIDGVYSFDRTKPNAAFVAHSRTDVPALLGHAAAQAHGIETQAATIRGLQAERDAENERAARRLARAQEHMRGAQTERDAARKIAEAERELRHAGMAVATHDEACGCYGCSAYGAAEEALRAAGGEP